MLKISTCPTCGSKRIKKFKRDWTDEFQGKTYTVPTLEFHECPDCGESFMTRRPCGKSKRIPRLLPNSEREKGPHNVKNQNFSSNAKPLIRKTKTR
jgi:YgiT-type zinc finger domain-containing protein